MLLTIPCLRHFVVYVLFSSTLVLSSQFVRADIRLDVQELMQAVRSGSVVDSSKVLASPATEVLPVLRTYSSDPSLSVRMHTVRVAMGLSRTQPDPSFRQQVVSYLVAVAVSDPDKGICGWTLSWLLRFPAEEFTEESRQAIAKLLDVSHPHSEALLLAGALNLTTQRERLVKLANNVDETGLWWGRRSWSARRALARMGDKDQIQYVIQQIEAEPEPVLRVTYLLKSLAYLKQPAAEEILIKYLFSEEVLPKLYGYSAPYSQYALDLLTQAIDNFPVKSKGSPMYTEDELETARDWFRNRKSTF